MMVLAFFVNHFSSSKMYCSWHHHHKWDYIDVYNNDRNSHITMSFQNPSGNLLHVRSITPDVFLCCFAFQWTYVWARKSYSHMIFTLVIGQFGNILFSMYFMQSLVLGHLLYVIRVLLTVYLFWMLSTVLIMTCATFLLVVDKVSLHRTVTVHLVFLLYIVKRHDVCDNLGGTILFRILSGPLVELQWPCKHDSKSQCLVCLGLENTSTVNWLSSSGNCWFVLNRAHNVSE